MSNRDRPNILFIISDQHRFDASGCSGGQLAGRDNVERYAPHDLGFRYNRPGYSGRYNRYNRPCMLDEDLMFDNLVTDQVIGFLQERRDKPFFIWCGLEKPHPEWTAPPRFHAIFHPDEMPLPATYRERRTDLPPIMGRRFRPHGEAHGAFAPPGRHTAEEEERLVRGATAAYHATVSYLDWNIGRILACLDRQGLRDDTLVVYTSDHGDNLFEHGLVQKHCFFEGAVRVPLLFSQPSLPQGAVRQRIANLVDILPTLLELADIATPDSLEGQSLVPTMAGADALQGTAISDFYEFGVPERMIRTPEWKYVYSHGDGDQLYDMVNDPAETRNLAAQESAAAVRNTLRDQLLKSWDGVPDTWQPRSS